MKQEKDRTNGRFLPGNTGGSGRPKGARSKLSEEFLAGLQSDFAEHGVDVIAQVRAERPHDYLKLIASVLPKDLNVEWNSPVDPMRLTDEQLRAIAAG